MDTPALRQSLGLELPSPAHIVGAIVFGLVGMAAFRLGRRRERPRTVWLGVALMLYPSAVSRSCLLYGVEALPRAGIVLDGRQGP